MSISKRPFQNISSRSLTKVVLWLCALTLLWSVAAPMARAQTFTRVGGSVLDPTGAAVPGAQVTLTNEGTGAVRTTLAGADGTYGIAQVPAGEYALTVEAKGFKKWIHEHVEVLVATPTTVHVTLQIGEVVQSVTVTGNVETVDTQDASVGSAFNRDQITEMPFAARNPVNLLTLQPGVVFTGSSDTDLLSMGSTQSLDPREGVVQSGNPFTVLDSANPSENGSGGLSDRPNLVPGCNLGTPAGVNVVQEQFNTSCFVPVVVGSGQFGTAGRNIVIGPGLFNIDFGLIKRIPIHDTYSLEFRAEFFNALNHPNFEISANDIRSSLFGQILSTHPDSQRERFSSL